MLMAKQYTPILFVTQELHHMIQAGIPNFQATGCA